MVDTRTLRFAGCSSYGAFAPCPGSELLGPGLQPTGSRSLHPPSVQLTRRLRGGTVGECGREAAERAGTPAAVFGLVTVPCFLQPTRAPAGAAALLCRFSSYLEAGAIAFWAAGRVIEPRRVPAICAGAGCRRSRCSGSVLLQSFSAFRSRRADLVRNWAF